MLKQKVDLEKEKKATADSAAEKDVLLKKKLKTIGNIVHESVPVHNDEVCGSLRLGSDRGLKNAAANNKLY